MVNGYFMQTCNNINDLKQDFLNINYDGKYRIKYNYTNYFKDYNNSKSFI